MTDAEFQRKYVQRLRDLNVRYDPAEFLNPNNPLWPQQSFDYPYGQAPEVDDLPPEELAAWEKYVAPHYLEAALGNANQDASANQVAQYGIANLKPSMYAPLSDDLFTEMLCEGLFSKLLCDLDDLDYARFKLTRADPQQDPYLKIDLSCMQIVTPYNTAETVVPTVVVVRRKKDPTSGQWLHHWQGGYELVGIDFWKTNRETDPATALMFPPATSGEAQEMWRRAKYFVLQGCLHRIILIDHVLVHFPNDTINAITKSVLPKWHPLHQLLMPHFWLTLPVNNSVLEGPRSLINRDTWYPWSPFTANGGEIRKLMPFSWKGWPYYAPGKTNTAYPPYSFCVDPTAPPVTPKPAAVEPSEYRRLLNDVYRDTRYFIRNVVSASGLEQPLGGKPPDHAWLEVTRWAHEIARFLPGFPSDEKLDADAVACAVATVIWNASAVHSYDHGALHLMMNDPDRPMPFVLRVGFDGKAVNLGDVLAALGPQGNSVKPTGPLGPLDALLIPPLQFLQKALAAKNPVYGLLDVKKILGTLEGYALSASMTPLASPADLLYGQMADLLFFMPHNSSLLHDCKYAFLGPDPFPNRFQLTQGQRDHLSLSCGEFRLHLEAYDTPVGVPPKQWDVRTRNGVPYAKPPDAPPRVGQSWTDADKQAFRVSSCIAAGIQY